MLNELLERLIKEAGWAGIYTQWVSPTERESMTVPVTTEQVAKFAELVAAAEREACAKVCENSVFSLTLEEWQGMTKKEHGAHAGRVCAEQIRMRSNKV